MLFDFFLLEASKGECLHEQVAHHQTAEGEHSLGVYSHSYRYFTLCIWHFEESYPVVCACQVEPLSGVYMTGCSFLVTVLCCPPAFDHHQYAGSYNIAESLRHQPRGQLFSGVFVRLQNNCINCRAVILIV
jgi:hypothetical protein